MSLAYVLVAAQPLSSNSTLDDISFKDILTRTLFSLYGSVNGSFYVDVLAVTQKQSNGLQKVALKCSSKHQQLLENAISMAPTSQTTFLDSAFKLSVLDSANTPSILNTITQSEYIDAQLSQF